MMYRLLHRINSSQKIVFTILLISSVCPSSKSCINGDNPHLGAVFEPYTKYRNDRLSTVYPVSEIEGMINLLSTRFHRISTYGNENLAFASSRTPIAVANANVDNSNISMYAAIFDSRIDNFNTSLRNVLLTIDEANKKHVGSIQGLVIASHPSVTDLSKLYNFLQIIDSQVPKGSIQIGIRFNNCPQIIEAINTHENRVVRDNFLYRLNFVICHSMPTVFSTAELSAENLIKEFETFDKSIRRILPQHQSQSFEVIAETGWPTAGESMNGVSGSVFNMEKFWCKINAWSKRKAFKVDFFTAFDEPYKNPQNSGNPKNVAEANYGWWARIGNDSSDASDFEEKIHAKGTVTRSNTSNAITITFSVLGCLAFIALFGIIGRLYFNLKIAKNQLLTKKDILEFEMGAIGVGNNDDKTEDALKLPYDRRYEIPQSKFHIDESRLLGKGAFGSVYQGKLDGTGNDVAFKMTQSNCTATSLKSMLSEIKIMIHVGQHPNVINIIGAFTGEIKRGRILIAIELCENGSLEKALQMMNSNSENLSYQVCDETTNMCVNQETRDGQAYTKMSQWACEISNGMEFIASKNVIHADLAARNILLTANNTAKITDFGLSRRLYEYTNYVKQNQEPMPWRWMAIESLEHLTFSTKSDVWAFGVLLFEIFSLGTIPYPGLSWNQSFLRDLRNGLRLEQPQFADEAIYDLMKSCWALNAEDRPDFAKIKEALNSILNT